jgi:hypothetical protein
MWCGCLMADMCSFQEILLICAEVAGVDLGTCERPKADEIRSKALEVFTSAVPLAWENPGKVEAEIDGILRDIRKLRSSIAGLDGYSKSLARIHAEKDQRQKIDAKIIASAGDPERHAEAIRQFLEFSATPKEQWVDIAALANLEALEQALIRPAEVAIAASPPGAGRRPNRRAYRVAFAAAHVFRDLTGADPTFWNGGETPFSRMVRSIYSCAGIKADLRKPIEAAMRELSGSK